jgi:hypothetical protein
MRRTACDPALAAALHAVEAVQKPVHAHPLVPRSRSVSATHPKHRRPEPFGNSAR